MKEEKPFFKYHVGGGLFIEIEDDKVRFVQYKLSEFCSPILFDQTIERAVWDRMLACAPVKGARNKHELVNRL
jgi:hypothetical protein